MEKPTEKPTEKQINFAKSLNIENPEKYDKKTLSGMIEANIGSTEGFKPTEQKVPMAEETTRDHSYDKDPTGLAVEIFSAISARATDVPVKDIMTESINLVKQAQVAFE